MGLGCRPIEQSDAGRGADHLPHRGRRGWWTVVPTSRNSTRCSQQVAAGAVIPQCEASLRGDYRSSPNPSGSRRLPVALTTTGFRPQGEACTRVSRPVVIGRATDQNAPLQGTAHRHTPARVAVASHLHPTTVPRRRSPGPPGTGRAKIARRHGCVEPSGRSWCLSRLALAVGPRVAAAFASTQSVPLSAGLSLCFDRLGPLRRSAPPLTNVPKPVCQCVLAAENRFCGNHESAADSPSFPLRRVQQRTAPVDLRPVFERGRVQNPPRSPFTPTGSFQENRPQIHFEGSPPIRASAASVKVERQATIRERKRSVTWGLPSCLTVESL